MKSLARLVLVGFFATAPILAIGCAEERETGTKPPPPPPENAYVGAATCATCHAGIATTFGASLHPGMVTVVNGQRPSAPPNLPDNPPAGKAWADITYVLGGWGWKARFVMPDMQVVVGENAQYDIPTAQFEQGAWAAYHVGETTPYNYACFRCHTTGPDEATNTFVQPGVQCEACHGMGKLHAQNPPGTIVRDASAACGRCHSRDPNGTRIVAEDGFLANHQQYAELKAGPHHELTCTACHDPHKGIRGGQVGGIVQACTSAGCHEGQEASGHNYEVDGHPITCIDCHMSRATRSARSINKYQGDVRTHIFKIHQDAEGAEGQADMFETVGDSTWVKPDYGVTLDYACYSCHRDEEGVGGDRMVRSLAQLYAKAPVIHPRKNLAGK